MSQSTKRTPCPLPVPARRVFFFLALFALQYIATALFVGAVIDGYGEVKKLAELERLFGGVFLMMRTI